MTQGRLLPTPMHSCHAHVGTIPVKHTGHLKVPPMPSKLCSMRWQRSLAGESNIWLHSLHSWLMPSSARESDNFSDAHAGATGAKIPCTSPRTPPHQPQDTVSPGAPPCTSPMIPHTTPRTPPCTIPGTPPCTSPGHHPAPALGHHPAPVHDALQYPTPVLEHPTPAAGHPAQGHL